MSGSTYGDETVTTNRCLARRILETASVSGEMTRGRRFAGPAAAINRRWQALIRRGVKIGAGRASMVPRLLSRGELETPTEMAVIIEGFNEAATSQPRKPDHAGSRVRVAVKSIS